MMDSWWQLGEGIGLLGSEMQVYRLQCPFCYEKGNFELVFHEEKKKPNSEKKLNFEVYECCNCKGYVHLLWSASEHGRLYDYRVLPWSIDVKAPEHWPEDIQSYWVQAHRSVKGDSWDAATVMARSALQLALRDHGAVGRSLKQEIDDLASKGILPPIMKDWSDELRLLGNISAHPRIGEGGASSEDVEDTIEFLDFLLIYLYDLPKQIDDYRARRDEESDEL